MEKTTKNGIHRIRQEGGKTIAWAEESGVKVLEKDGYYFKDLAKTGELLPYENWRLSDEERAADLAGRLSIEEIAGLMLYSPHQAVPPMPGGPFQGTFDGKTYLESGKEPYAISDQQKEFLEDEHIRHILLTNVESPEISANGAMSCRNGRRHCRMVFRSTSPLIRGTEQRIPAQSSRAAEARSANGRRVSALQHALTRK